MLHPDRRDRTALAGLFALALVLRLTLGVWAPLHINGQGALWIGAAALRPSMLAGYGPGYPELFSVVTMLARGAPDLAIFAANATMSALVPVLAFALARIAALDRERALVGAVVLAIDPVAVRFSATESYFVPIAVLTLASSTAIAAAVHMSMRSRAAGIALLLAGALLATQAARIHPVAWIPIALCPLAAWVAGSMPLSRRLVVFVVASLVVAASVWLTSAGWVAATSSDAIRYSHGTSHRIGRPIVVVVVALAFALARRQHSTLVLVGAVSLALDLVLRPIYGQSAAWQACFDRLFLAMPVLAVAAVLPTALLRGKLRMVTVVGVLVVAAVLAWPLRTPTTEQLEYRWLREELAGLAPGCRVASVSRAQRRVLYLPWYAMTHDREPAPARWFAVASPAALAETARHGGCIVWVHASICENADGRPVCESIERAVSLSELASIEIDAVPSARDYPYDVPTVRLALSRVSPL